MFILFLILLKGFYFLPFSPSFSLFFSYFFIKNKIFITICLWQFYLFWYLKKCIFVFSCVCVLKKYKTYKIILLHILYVFLYSLFGSTYMFHKIVLINKQNLQYFISFPKIKRNCQEQLVKNISKRKFLILIFERKEFTFTSYFLLPNM